MIVSSLIHDVWDCPPIAAYLNNRRAWLFLRPACAAAA